MRFFDRGEVLVHDAHLPVVIKDEDLRGASMADVFLQGGSSRAADPSGVEGEGVAGERGTIAQHHDLDRTGRGQDICIPVEVLALAAGCGQASGLGPR